VNFVENFFSVGMPDVAFAGKTLRPSALLVMAAIGPYYGGGLMVASGARLHDGRLTLSIYRRFRKWELLSHFHSISRARYRCSPKIETFSAAEIELASPNIIAVHIDGQPLGQTPVKLPYPALCGSFRRNIP
jgi:diacylglycerol kinase (ATP)